MTDDRSDRVVMPARGVTLDSEVLVQRRRELGLTQEALAALAGLTDRTIRSAERRRPLSIASARLLAAALELPLPALMWRSPAELRRRLTAAGCAPGEPPRPWGERRADVTRLVATLADAERGAVAVVSGRTGIGKTALARYVAHAVGERFPGGVLWVHGGWADLDGTLTSQLRLAGALDFRARLPPAEVAGRAAFDQAFRFNLWSARRLIVLDDVARGSDVTCFVRPGDPAWVLITTMHRTVAHIPADLTLEVGPLPDPVGVDLLSAHLGAARVAAEPDAAVHLVRLLGGVPRSLQIAGRVLERERYTRLADYAKRLEASPAEPDDRLRDAPAANDASFTTAYHQLARWLSPDAWRFFGALSAFGGRSFDATWAAAVGGVTAVDARRHLGELAEFYLLAEVDGVDGAGAPRRFTLDAQSHRAARWIAGPRAEAAEERLVDLTCERAVELARLPTAVAVQAFVGDLERWRHGIELAVRRVVPEPVAPIAVTPTTLPAVPTGVEHHAARLCRLLAALRKPLYLTMPPGVGRWLTVGLGAARAVGDDGAYGQLCRLMARWTGLTAPDLQLMVAWYHAAVPALLTDGNVDDAMDAKAYAAKVVIVADAMAVGLPMLTAAVEDAARLGASPVYQAALANAAACVSCVVGSGDRAAPAEAALRDALSLELVGPWGAIVGDMLRLNAATAARVARPDGPTVDVSAEVATLRTALPDDPLSDFILDAVAAFARDGSAPAAVDDHTRRLVWLGVPREIAFRRLVQGLQLALEVPQYCAPGDGDSRLRLIHPIGVTPLFLGHPLEVEIPLPGLLYPVAPLLALLGGGGARHLAAFVAQSVGPDSPRMALFERLVRLVG